MKLYLSHGKESGPWSNKLKRLAAVAKNYRFEVDSIDYTDTKDPDLRAERLLDILQKENQNYILAGSSMGGYVSLVVSEIVNPKALFLMAPALFMPTYKKQEYNIKQENLEIVHGWSDTVIPPEHSIKFAKSANATLHLIDGDHVLNSSIETVVSIFEQFMKKVTDM